MAEDRAAYTTGGTSQPEGEIAETSTAKQWYAKVPATVIRDRRLTSGARDVLLALLLYANANGTCYPRQSTIADDLGIQRTAVNRHMRLLRSLGYLTIDSGKDKGAQCVYHINLTPDVEGVTSCYTPPRKVKHHVTGGVTSSDTGCNISDTPILTEPCNNPNEHSDADASGAADASAEPVKPSPSRSKQKTERGAQLDEVRTPPDRRAPPHARKPNPLWDALVEVFGYTPQSRPEASNWGKIVHDLKEAGATADDVRARAGNHAAGLASGAIHWTLTPNALVVHWGELSRVPTTAHGKRARAAPAAQPARTVRSASDVSPWK